MQLSAKKQRDLTYLEVQAQQMVNDEDDEPIVNDEERYEAMLAKRQERRTVNQLNLDQTFSQGESLYDFLERQVKNQMREALGQPLQNISQELLNKVVSKDVQKDLRKYKMNIGKTPNKEKKGGQLSAEKGGAFPSPQRRLQFANVGSPDRAATEDRFYYDQENLGGNSKEVRELLKELDSGIHDKLSLIKMLIIKCGEADGNYKKVKSFLIKDDIDNAEKILTMVEQMNAITLKDLQNEIQQKTDLLDIVAELGDQIQRERREIGQSKSIGKDKGNQENYELRKQVGELQDRIRDLESQKSNRKEQINRDLMQQLNEADEQVTELKRRLEIMERENMKLRDEMKLQVDDFQRQLDIRDNRNDGGQELVGMLRKENDAYKSENRLLRERITSITQELDNVSKQRTAGQKQQILESEITHLRQQLLDKDRELSKQNDYYKNILVDKDAQISKQKNEWAEIYGNMKSEIDDLKNDNKILKIESEKILKQLELGGGGNRQLEKELAKKLKKRELECQALWDTLKDMHVSARNVFDARQMLDLLALRALDTKAKRKLKI